MLSVDEENTRFFNNSDTTTISSPPPAVSSTPSHEIPWKKKPLSLNVCASPSPLHQTLLPDEDDAITITASKTSSSTSSDADTLLDERSTWGRVSLPSWSMKGSKKRNISISSPEMSSPTSPTLSECSLDSSAPLWPCTSTKLRSLSECSNEWQPHPPIHRQEISSPVLDSSSIDATMRSSFANDLNLDVAIAPPQPTFQRPEAKSWPSRHHGPVGLAGGENDVTETDNPMSSFSDTEDSDSEHPSTGKTFKRRFSETLGTCFLGRKK